MKTFVIRGDRDGDSADDDAGEHGAPADGNCGDQRIKKLWCRSALPQGLTDDYELLFQPIKPSRYYILGISHLMLSRVFLKSLTETPMMKSILWAFRSCLRTPRVCLWNQLGLFWILLGKPWWWWPSPEHFILVWVRLGFVYETANGLSELS